MISEGPKKSINERYCVPTRLDTAPFGTICVVDGEGYYIQLSKDESSAIWEKIDYLFGSVFKPFITDDKFIEACLLIFLGERSHQYEKISEIIKSKHIY